MFIVTINNFMLLWLQAATEALKAGNSVVADNTNPTQAARKEFIDCAKKSGNFLLFLKTYSDLPIYALVKYFVCFNKLNRI